jgi:hypothetical protein
MEGSIFRNKKMPPGPPHSGLDLRRCHHRRGDGRGVQPLGRSGFNLCRTGLDPRRRYRRRGEGGGPQPLPLGVEPSPLEPRSVPLGPRSAATYSCHHSSSICHCRLSSMGEGEGQRTVAATAQALSSMGGGRTRSRHPPIIDGVRMDPQPPLACRRSAAYNHRRPSLICHRCSASMGGGRTLSRHRSHSPQPPPGPKPRTRSPAAFGTWEQIERDELR